MFRKLKSILLFVMELPTWMPRAANKHTSCKHGTQQCNTIKGRAFVRLRRRPGPACTRVREPRDGPCECVGIRLRIGLGIHSHHILRA
jgi:hypothetical protein